MAANTAAVVVDAQDPVKKGKVIPDIEVRYNDISYSIVQTQQEAKKETPNALKMMVRTALFPLFIPMNIANRKRAEKKHFVILDKISGVIRPGTLTLVLAPPGHGKSAFLKALTQRLPKGALSGGEVSYSGVTPSNAAASGIHLGQLAQYVSQLDEHLPYLTVKETYSFVHGNACVDEGEYNVPSELTGGVSFEKRVEDITHFLKMENCANTIVGNDLLRGISGGEKKRVTVGEGLLTNARFLALDEISTGLDSAVTFDIVNSLRKRAQANGLGVVIALLQPTPEVYNLFDEVVLLREGAVVYHGPRDALPGYLQSLGFHPPAEQVVPPGGFLTTPNLSASADPSAPPTSLSLAAPGGAPTARQSSMGGADGSGVKVDMADWLVDLISEPARIWRKGAAEAAGSGSPGTGLGHKSASVSSDLAGASGLPLPSPVNGNGAVDADIPISGPVPPLTTAALAEAWRASDLFKKQMGAPASTAPLSLTSEFATRQYAHSYSHSVGHHIKLLMQRQFTLMARNKLYLRSKLISSAFLSIVLGGLYYQRTLDQGMTFYGLYLNANMMMGFSNFAEMATIIENKFVAYKHVANGNYPASGFVLSGFLAHLPIAVMETLLFTSILYFMSGMNPTAAGYFFFWLVVLLTDILMRNLMAVFSYIGKSLQAAQAMPLPMISLMIIFAGFLVTKDKMGWLEFMSYLDVFTYALRALAQNEFLSDRYNVPVPGQNGKTLGEFYLSNFGLETDRGYTWGGVGFQLGIIVVVVVASIRAFSSVRFDKNVGSARQKEKVDAGASAAASMVPSASQGSLSAIAKVNPMKEASNGNTDPAASETGSADGGLTVRVPIPTPDASVAPTPTPAAAAVPTPASTLSPSSDASVLPFTPCTVAFKDISYTVKLAKHMGGGNKTLLRGITGYALPGRMLALMGASGAGKTTLLDVLGGRKNSGVMGGSILLNGFPKEAKSFNRVTSYVEQQDIHNPLTTVREALEFSAALRLPGSITAEQRAGFVTHVLDILELTDIADRLVGQPTANDGLAPGERKRLTIGVELVSNAPVIFLDEPTSGLDARAAAIVMRVIRRVSTGGRTVICTIHQPSAELFFAFDDLLLLQRGGYQVYYGPLGHHGKEMVKYLEAVPGMGKKPHGLNPASWMLDALAGTDSSDKDKKKAKAAPAPIVPAGATSIDVKPAADAPIVSTVLAGQPLQEHLHASAVWKKVTATVESPGVGSPAPGASPLRFPTTHARSFAVQYWVLLGRQWRTYSRNTGLNFGRWVALTFLMILFGVVYYHIYDNSNDIGGVQSLVASIFMVSAFGAMVNMNVSVPALLGARPVFYREQASAMFDPTAYNLSLITVEIPWLAGILLWTTPIGYFMFGLKATAAAFWFHYLCSVVLAFVYVSMGQFIANAAPTFEVAQALLGVIGPLYFLWGGMWSPPSGMVPGARWFTWVDPIYYAFQALIPQQFECDGGAAAGCPTVQLPTSHGLVTLDRYAYVVAKYEFHVEDQWKNLGYLAIFIIVFQVLGILAVRYIRHIVR